MYPGSAGSRSSFSRRCRTWTSIVVASGQHDDRHLALGSQPLAYLEPVELRQHDVEHDQVHSLGCEARQRFLTVTRLQDAIALALQGVSEELLDGILVVDEEDG